MLKPSQVGLIIGKRGSGKTTLCKQIIQNNPRFIVYDVNFEYDYKEFNAVPVYRMDELEMLLKQNEPRIIFKPRIARGQVFEYFCCVVWSFAKDYLIVLSEFDELGMYENYFRTLVHRGRHKNIGLLGDARRPYGFPRLFLTQLDVLFVGILKSVPEDFRYLKEFLPAEAYAQVEKMQRYSFMRWCDEPEQLELKDSVKLVSNKKPFL